MCLEFTCLGYPEAPFHKLRVCCDFMNWLFHLDDLSDDMDDRSTVAIGNEVMTAYNHHDTYDPTTNVGKLAKRFLYPSPPIINTSELLIPLQLLDPLYSRMFPRVSKTVLGYHGPLLQIPHNPSS